MPIDERELSAEGKAILDASRDSVAKSMALGIVGAILGGVVGWLACTWLAQQGFYALALPGAAIGLGYGALSKRPMIAGGLLCAVAALAVGITWEGLNRPFIADESFSFFLAHLQDLKPVSMLFIGLGVVFAFWFGRGR